MIMAMPMSESVIMSMIVAMTMTVIREMMLKQWETRRVEVRDRGLKLHPG